jgi:hypothetical protein
MSCPLCGGPIPNALDEGKYSGALSRRDNKTEICSACGVKEAVDDYNRRSEIVELPFTPEQLNAMGNPTYVTPEGWVTWE